MKPKIVEQCDKRPKRIINKPKNYDEYFFDSFLPKNHFKRRSGVAKCLNSRYNGDNSSEQQEKREKRTNLNEKRKFSSFYNDTEESRSNKKRKKDKSSMEVEDNNSIFKIVYKDRSAYLRLHATSFIYKRLYLDVIPEAKGMYIVLLVLGYVKLTIILVLNPHLHTDRLHIQVDSSRCRRLYPSKHYFTSQSSSSRSVVPMFCNLVFASVDYSSGPSMIKEVQCFRCDVG